VIVRLHIGDSYLQPDYPLPIEQDFIKKHPDFNGYCDTMGLDIFREILLGKLREDNALVVDIENILITCGATNALSASVAALLNSGVSVAPGIDFGTGFEYYIRLCFTGEPPERLNVVVRRINEVLDV
jgi:aspartate/methionine/tyrosine aminotransferase